MLLLSRCVALLLCAAAAGAQPGEMPGPAQGAEGMAARSQIGRASKKGAKEDVAPVRIPLLVDAAAYGPRGEPLRSLSAADFAVSLRDQPQKIVSVTYVNAEAGTISPVSASVALRPDEIHRTLVLIADDLGLSLAGAQNVRQTLTRFLREQMHDGDMVSILRTASGTGAAQKLTSDRRELAEAIGGIQYNPDTGGKEAFASGARSVFRQALLGLTDPPGRKGVVLFTENDLLFAKPPQTQANAADASGRKADVPAITFDKPATSALVDIANRASAVVSLIDVRGSLPEPAGPAGGLAEVALQTGGRFATHTTDPSGALAETLQDQLGYYLVSYEAADASHDLLSGSPLPQRPVLKCTRADVQLLARSGPLNSENFVSDPGGTDVWRPSFTTPVSDLQRGFTKPFASGGIPMQFVAVYTAGKAGPQVEGRLHINAKDLTFTHWLDGRTTATLDIQLAAMDENGRSLQNAGGIYELQLTADQFQEGLKSGFGATPKLSIHNPGAYQVRVAVRDGTSGRIGSAGQFVDAPDISGGKLVITSMDLTSQDAAAAGRITLRVLEPGESFRYSYQMVNLTVDESKASQIEVQTRILHDGVPIFDSKQRHLDFAPSENSRVRSAEGAVKLGSSIKPGYYVLHVTVTDKLAEEPRTATRYLQFEVK
jgi:VWFA-related protein